mgnify:CR=1 FL=1
MPYRPDLGKAFYDIILRRYFKWSLIPNLRIMNLKGKDFLTLLDYTPEEIAAIEKKISGVQNNNSSCLYTRGGSTKAKIILDPLGCRGVTDSYDTPERERNHKIFDGGSVVYVPGFNINISNLGKEMTYKGKGWGKDFAGNTVHEFTPPETKRIEEGALQSIGEGTAMETFSARN